MSLGVVGVMVAPAALLLNLRTGTVSHGVLHGGPAELMTAARSAAVLDGSLDDH